MATDEDIKLCHDMSDLLFAEAQEKFANLPSGKHTLEHHKYSGDDPEPIHGTIVRIDAWWGEVTDLRRRNIEGQAQLFTVIRVDWSSDNRCWFGLGVYDSHILHYASHPGETYVVFPRPIDDFHLVLDAVREEIQSGKGIVGKQAKG
ncbi:MAG: hypothetical protein KGI68_13715 [Alphaproteobacteria bacterium]|nr:hypothetical protein [Alphaproteobacteria bacterium]MDE2164250.1 hypothetical protein [Alphaproteobacteria bacterium]MDE2500013.1 hypothetical protein [Alphaproteobacteria bacterium]